MKGKTLGRMASIVFFLTRAPRTTRELANLLGMARNTYSIRVLRDYVDALVAEGLVAQDGTRRDSKKGPAAILWKWKPHEA